MPTRIEIELTSSASDGSWTWRAAGAREPRGVLDGTILPGGSSVGDQLRVETEQDLDGIRVVSVVQGKDRSGRAGVLELLPSDAPFEPVVEHRQPARRDGRRDGRDRRDGADRPRRSRDDRTARGDRPDDARRSRPDGDRRGRPATGDRPEGAHPGGDRDRGQPGGRRPAPDGERRHRPYTPPPPEVPQRPKPKRLRPGKQHRTEVLTSLAEEQRPVAELALQGMAAVRQRLREDNARLRDEGKPEMPEAAVVKMAEELIPRLRVADWLDRAEAAQRQLAHLDLRDLRSVVASADDPAVARDESTRTLAVELKQSLIAKQDEELRLWLADVEAAVDVGRVVRALRLSAMPPKAGVPFPPVLARRLSEVATASLLPTDGPDRWAAVLEAAAFSPVRSLVTPAAPAEQRNDDLLATVRRLGPLLPHIAALYGVEVRPGAPAPRPLRPGPARPDARKRVGARRPPTPTPTQKSEPTQRQEPTPAPTQESQPTPKPTPTPEQEPPPQEPPTQEPQPPTQEQESSE